MEIAVLLSGGVDSSVALRLLKDQGHDLTAFYLKIWLQDEFSFLGECPWEEDLKFVKAVCEQSQIPLEILSLQTEYWESVVTYTIEEIKAGRTPNPDMFCNSLIKFGQFYDKIDSSFEKVASGHYANVIFNGDSKKYFLTQSPDPVKDQTYFLAYLTQQQLSRALFPIGEYDKKQIRKLAEEFNLPNKNRKDSQGICFLGQVKFNEFVKHHLGEIPGEIIDLDTGNKMGHHNGYYFYTIGQRSGLKLSGGPWFVVGKDIKRNIIYISRENKSLREKNEFLVGKFNWISGSKPENEKLEVKIRHGAKKFECKISFNDDDSALVNMNEADSGIAPGQFAVFYDNDLCLGGGVIL
ncbi:MAG: tRNA 2-thiouridine(34) synthase MnmA [Ignavibacteria bacterium RIFOXYB2_FULL_35_12]|nr:MAG: tRNA 2-thiouridine(34) synthase MnmA [Ignavibacteria bacterium GWA2_36_19]OGU49350.1 MAG: tRNA 2-thiouridine(34) synthase MnmA [Ignavibacteria bacterium GWC2_35_8]OGU61279.1 MAG: tRNA 2-thiouridine(34) synthase MnmA [Ignavibacteria bacterium GWF2_35_20]OGU84115.1 MAG: tRNA 2-thiouridine(34) synthase MnmA [Ignavibacteria bacterium RIFOXYA12_FULL_35_25]OGU92237.1 MAG: tRNA 2-thiouridine(34) synthase MnmA [Ignavibacteria bacterium RIFOXYC12_FULL_35_11]OGU92874.1 MAG: tRNA 2-thiouridine(34